MSAHDLTPEQADAISEMEKMLHPDRCGSLKLILEASAGLAQASRAMHTLVRRKQFDLPADIRLALLRDLPLWQGLADRLPRMFETIRVRVARLDARDATVRAIEGGQA